MAYQPKYGRGRQPQKPKSTPLSMVLTAVIVVVSVLLTVPLLKVVYFSGGETAVLSDGPGKLGDQRLSQALSDHVQSGMERAEAALLSEEMPEETIPPLEVKYTLEKNLLVAPEPNQALFGQTQNPSTLTNVLKAAQYILEGQELYFSTDVELFAGSSVTYYLDETIFAITWKTPIDNSVYTFSEVKVAHPSQFRRHLSDGKYGSGKLYLPSEMAATVNAVVATSGDFYANRRIFGVVAYDGKVCRSVDDNYGETCYIDENGDLLFSYKKQLGDTETAQAFLDENNVQFSLAFGPILVDNSEMTEIGSSYGVGEIDKEYARSALCQMDRLHYLIAVANWEDDIPDDPTVARFQKVVASTGCKMAYCLDGGQTAAVIMNDKLINRPAKGEQRKISDIIYFATAVPEGG